VVVLLTLAGPVTAAQERSAAEVDRCLAALPALPEATPATQAVDRRYDRTRHGASLACDLQVRASAVRQALEQLRAAVLYGDEDALHAVLAFPVTVHYWATPGAVRPTSQETVTDVAGWWAVHRRAFGAHDLQVLGCASVTTLTVVTRPRPGLAVANGRVWLERTGGGPALRVRAVNLVPLDEKTAVYACYPEVAGDTVGRGTVAPTGFTVLGRTPDARRLAEDLGADWERIPQATWDRMSPQAQRAEMLSFLDQGIRRGHDFVLPYPVPTPAEATGPVRQQLEYLISKGYRLSDAGTRLTR
jgi:hypothetical protein